MKKNLKPLEKNIKNYYIIKNRGRCIKWIKIKLSNY